MIYVNYILQGEGEQEEKFGEERVPINDDNDDDGDTEVEKLKKQVARMSSTLNNLIKTQVNILSPSTTHVFPSGGMCEN